MPTTIAAGFLTALLIAVAVGAATAFQPGINARLASFSTHRLHGSVVNFVVGLLAVLAVCLILRTPLPKVERVAQAPWWAFLGGLLGATYVTAALWLIPRIGGVNYFAALVLGQMIAHALIDHYGLMGLPQQSFTLVKGAGLVLIFIGVVMVTGAKLW